MRHNAIVYEICRDWTSTGIAEPGLVNFTGDAALVTFPEAAAELALAFAWEVVDQVHHKIGSETSIGVDVGEVAILSIDGDGPLTISGSRQAAGYPVDRAVRLSWIARPGEVLATLALTKLLPDTTKFDLSPVDPAAVSLDKWPPAQLELGGQVLVHSISRTAADRASLRSAPANIRLTAEYLRRLQLNACEMLRELPGQWILVLNGFRMADRWMRKEALETFLEKLERSKLIDNSVMPELIGSQTGMMNPISIFRNWRDDTIASIYQLLEGYNDLTLADVESIRFNESMERAVGELIIYSRAGLRKLELSA